MVSKDQAIGGLIFIVCVVVIIGYITGLFFYDNPKLGISIKEWLNLPWSTSRVQYWLVAVPVLIAFVAVLAIGAWIGWTMATTPPPKPIEEFEAEETKEEEEEKKE
jgi:predicted DNA-binding transcriptional regulator